MTQENFQIAFGNYDKSPESYFLSETNRLRATIFLALKLGKPLLVTGEPGTGKSQLLPLKFAFSERDNYRNLAKNEIRPIFRHSVAHIN